MSTSEFVTDAPSLLRERAESGERLVKRIAPVKIDVGDPGGFDYRREIEKMAAATKAGSSQLQIDLTKPAAFPGLVSKPLDIKELLFNQAREHLAQKQFQEALGKLDKYLSEQQGHAEAYFLRAVCLLNIDAKTEGFERVLRALEALQPLAGPQLGPALSARIDILRNSIRATVFDEFPAQFMTVDHHTLTAQLDRIIALDPEGSIVYALQAIVLLEQGEIMAAYDCAEAGIGAATDDVPPILTGLHATLGSELLHEVLGPAIHEYKQGQYDRARKALTKVNPRFANNREYQLLAAHLKRAGGGGFLGFFGSKRMPSELTFEGSDEDRWALQRLIVREELTQARYLIQLQQMEAAERAARNALAFAPGLPLACYLAAGCGFRRVTDAVMRGDQIGLDEVLDRLPVHARLAEAALADPGVGAAAALAVEIHSALEFFQGLQAEVLRQRAEVQLVNGIIEEFGSLMATAERGIDGVESFQRIRERMLKLRTRVQGAKAKVAAEEGREALEHIEARVAQNLETLDKIDASIASQRKDMTVVDEAAKRLHDALQPVKNGVGSERDLAQLETKLNKLKQDLPGYRNRLRSQAAKQHVEALSAAVDDHLNQVSQLKRSLAEQQRDRAFVDAEIETFQSIGARLKTGGFSSRSELSSFRTSVDAARSAAHIARIQLQSDGARAALDQLVEQYDAILTQIDKVL